MSKSTGPEQQADTRSLGAIVGDIANDLSTMVRSELELAKTEAKQEAVKAGKAGGMFGGAAVAGYFTLLFLSLTAMYMIGTGLDIEWAALIVTAVWALAAAVLAVLGRSKLKQLSDTPLEKTQKTIKEDVQWAKNQK